MILTILDPRTGKTVTITVPEPPSVPRAIPFNELCSRNTFGGAGWMRPITGFLVTDYGLWPPLQPEREATR